MSKRHSWKKFKPLFKSGFFFKEWRLLISRLLDFFFQDSRGLIDMGIILTRKKFSTSRTDNKARLRINFANQDSNYMVL